ncbi:MAG TPA: biopolymer transporter ExbD [Myxococcaceae bacterium]|nr:biopolymer transporter ExbD [Myxococcaceae bacterium]
MVVASARRAPAEINVTPLVDVVLVLLIIFMVTTPLLDRDLELIVPQRGEPSAVAAPPLTLELREDGAVLFAGQPVAPGLEALSSEVSAVLSRRRRDDRDVLVMADSGLPYAQVVAALDTLKRAGAGSLGLTIHEEGTPWP